MKTRKTIILATMLLIGTLGSIQKPIWSETVILADGKEWQELTYATGASWNTLAATFYLATGRVKPGVNTVINGHDVAGNVWASMADLEGLFVSF